ncbi:MAG: von Willebrand factor type A domain protein [Candidatus Argoarchaeum ethanivorans]|uniref:von Willebrand factor type A domain protein n=1 Tax=Candidatus Argoarchaeum ethanivorans TaxID=2608793 RepID=A0A811T6P8_9EURY|nr:MAG: von Willebrand factor type A domain protein [Candidatus Argoarchaeum ethanivorans]
MLYNVAMRHLTLVVVVVCLAAIFLGCIEQDGEITKPAETELVLSDYPELFEKDVIIVIGSNASGIEIEAADAIVENLFDLTGNMPVIKTDAEITEDELAGHNLILVGGADSNEVLEAVYNMTDTMRVTGEYPGAGKGVLDMLRNPWDPEKAMLLVAGSDEWGVKAGSMKLLKGHFKDEEKLTSGYSTEFVAKTLNISPLSVSSFENDILTDIFGDYQFFEIYDGSNVIPPQKFVITLDSTGKPMDFNSLLRDANVDIKDDNKAIRVSKALVIYFSADGLSGFKFLKSSLEIPYQKEDFKNPVSYAEKVQPPSVSRIDNAFEVTLYTWCEEEGILIGWQVKIKDDKITSMIGEVIDTGIGHFKPRTEGVVHVPGYRISVEFDRASLIKSMSPADPGEIQVSDHWVEIRPLSADTESTTISISGFGANEVVDISITVGTHNIQDASGNPIQINTNGDGDGSTVFKPAQNSYSGRAEIEATSPSDHAVLEFGSFTDEGRCLTFEEIILDTATVDGNTVTFEVHYTDHAVDSVATQHKITPQSLLNAVTNAYQVQCGDWGFNRHLGADYDADGILHLYENDGQYDFHGDHGTNAYSGSERRINYQANLKFAFTNQGIDYAGENVIVGHEHFHGIQSAYNNGNFKWYPNLAYVEGTARFTQTIMDANAEHKSNSLFSLDANDYMSNTDRRLRDFSYNYCLYWGFLYQHNGGMATLEEIMEEIRSVGNNIETDLPQAITNVLSRVPGDHDTFEESVEDFSVAVYKKDFNWNGKDWGTFLNDVTLAADRTYPDDINKLNPVIKDTLNEWAADYVEVGISSDVKSGDAEVGFQGEGCLGGFTHSDYTVKLILFDATHPNGLVLDFVDDHKNDDIIPDIDEYDKVVAVIGCKDHCFGGDGDYTFTFESSLYLDVVLDTDRSGSMSGQKMTNAKNAAKTFIDLLEEPSGWWIFATDRDKVGLVSFASSATLDRQLTSDFNDAKSVIDGYSAYGSTNMGDALSKSINELKANGREGTTHTIIYFTDGMTNTGSTPDEILNILVPQAVDAGISIYTLGYGSNVNSAFLSQVASTGNGKYYFAPDGAALQQIYIELSHTTKGWQPVASFSGKVAQGETKAVGTLNVQPKTSLMKVVLSWPGSNLDLILIDPSGNQTMPGAGVIYSGNDALPEYYEVYDPEPGDWTIQVYGKDTTGATEDYNVMVFQPGALMQVNPTKWDVNYPLNRRTAFNVSEIAGNVNLTNVTFTASDLTETIAASAVKSLMKSQAEAEERGEASIATLTKEAYAQNTNVIPANYFSFTPNDFSVPSGESKNVEATLTLPSNSIHSGTYSGTINVSSDGGNSTIFVTVTVASVETATGTGTAYFASDAGTIEDLAALNESDLPEENPNVDFPHGLFSFNITGLSYGETVNVTINFPEDIPTTAQYWKYNASSGEWYQIPIGSNDGDNIITIMLQDGGIGDNDGVENGIISDPGAPGVPSAPPVPVPALTPIGMIVLIICLLGLLFVMSVSRVKKKV